MRIMRHARDYHLTLSRLAIYWRGMALLTLAFARNVLRQQRAGESRAYAEAEALETWCQIALFQIAAQAAAANPGEPSPQNTHALQTLGVMAASFLALLNLARKMKAGLATSARMIFLLQNTPLQRTKCRVTARAPARAIPILDTS